MEPEQGQSQDDRQQSRSPKPQTRAPISSPRSASSQSQRARANRTTYPSPRLEPQSTSDLGDRVYPVRSVVSIDPTQTPAPRSEGAEGYFVPPSGRDRRESWPNSPPPLAMPSVGRQSNAVHSTTTASTSTGFSAMDPALSRTPQNEKDLASHTTDLFSGRASAPSDSDGNSISSLAQAAARSWSIGVSSHREGEGAAPGTPLMTTRFQHSVQEDGHLIITGRGDEPLQRCEDEPIHIPGAIQSFGLLIALREEADGKLQVRVVSENSKQIIGYTPHELFALEGFCDILSEEQTDSLVDHIDFIREEDAHVAVTGPEVFTISIRPLGTGNKSRKLWCAVHVNDSNPGIIICEFELEDDKINPLVAADAMTPELPEDTLHSLPTAAEIAESTEVMSRPLRVLRSARKRKGEAAAMEVFNVMSQVQEQLATPSDLEKFLKVLVGVIKELTGFHRVMVYQFDNTWNGRVVTELVDPRATKDLYKGLHFPASDIPAQARELYKINRVRLLYDRDQETARLVCRTSEDLENPLDLTYSYLRAISPIHIKYLTNMAVRSSMSVSINAFNELWGLISCHSYGGKGMRVSFPIRKMCRLVGDIASRNIERLSYARRLQARKLINTSPTKHNPSGYIVATSEDLLNLFDADYGVLSIRDDTKFLGEIEQPQEALAILEYIRMRNISSVTTSQDLRQDFPDLRYPPGFSHIAGALIVPLSAHGSDFLIFLRKAHVKEVKWAGNPYEKAVHEGTQSFLEPRKSFKTWSETVVGACREWTSEQVETAAVLCLVYGKFIEVWRQKEVAMQNSQLTRLLLANSAHEVRTPLNAIINCIEIALEGALDQETRDNLSRSYTASKSLICTINDLLDLTKTVDGIEYIRGEPFDLRATLQEATAIFSSDSKRKGLKYDVIEHQGLPQAVVGDQRKVRQAISNITANAIQNTVEGSVQVEMYVTDVVDNKVDIEVAVGDTGIGMSKKKLDSLFSDLEQVETDGGVFPTESPTSPKDSITDKAGEQRTLGLGLAVVARIVRNMNGQLRVKSEEGKGSRFIIQLPFDLPEDTPPDFFQASHPMTSPAAAEASSAQGTREQKEVTLIPKEASRPTPRTGLQRVGSADSVASRNSLRSRKSGASNNSVNSAHSDVDRLIEALQEPHMAPRRASNSERPMSARSSMLGVDQAEHSPRRQTGDRPTLYSGGRTISFEKYQTSLSSSLAEAQEDQQLESKTGSCPAGEVSLPHEVMPIEPVKVPEEASTLVDAQDRQTASRILGPVPSEPHSAGEEAIDTQGLHVLIAEDDPVNSKILQKRLNNLGHTTRVTVNGEDCASVFKEQPTTYDVVLMDMQMPIVDGLSSTKMIRAFESAQSTPLQLSRRAAFNGRVPIIAVSASLVEQNMQLYVDAGFDGWILKPVSFTRLKELLEGIVDKEVREKAMYRPGHWETGGWFRRKEEKGEHEADGKQPA